MASPPLYTTSTHAYTTSPNPLQTITIHQPTLPPSASPRPPLWLIYIHGGAWRDPLITSSSLTPTLTHILTSPHTPFARTHITHYASISYSLSPYATHPTHPSTPADGPARNATHPAHLADVRAALAFLSARYGLGLGDARARALLVGHSCGATLAWQALLVDMQVPAWVCGIVSVAGIHDLSRLRRDAPSAWRGVYVEFLTGAFGPEGEGGSWEAASPVGLVKKAGAGQGRGVRVVLAQSRADELVGWGQVEGMREALEGARWVQDGRVSVSVVEMQGAHDECWETGEELGRVVEGVVRSIVEGEDE